jgi:ubiquinone/menaquinone biosynthesis C-methylase UbiE
MSQSNPSREPAKPRELAGTYFVEDRSNQEELARLRIQDNMLTRCMGGVLPEQIDPTNMKRVLDVGCGTGGWLIELAKTYPSISLLVGADISSRMVNYARAQAEAEGVSDRVEFHVMDALRMLEFPDGYFDLVNQRFGSSYLRTWDWPKLIDEFRRVTRLDGIIRFTESDMVSSNTEAFMKLHDLGIEVFFNSGHLFTREIESIMENLPRLLERYGVKNVQTRAYRLEFPAGTPEGNIFAEDMRYFFRVLVPFLRRWTKVPSDYEATYQQVLAELQRPDFVGKWNLLAAWGTNSPRDAVQQLD